MEDLDPKISLQTGVDMDGAKLYNKYYTQTFSIISDDEIPQKLTLRTPIDKKNKNQPQIKWIEKLETNIGAWKLTDEQKLPQVEQNGGGFLRQTKTIIKYFFQQSIQTNMSFFLKSHFIIIIRT